MTRKNRNQKSTRMIFTRYMLIVALFILWIGAIGARLVHLQINQHESLREIALNQRRDVVKQKMLRGTIFDRSMRPLAMSVKVSSLYADPAEIDNVRATSSRVAKILNVPSAAIEERIRTGKENGKRFVWLARKLDKIDVDKINSELIEEDIRKFDLPKMSGLHWREEQKRKYPYRSLAAHIIGFSNLADEGQAGIELAQEKALRGGVIKTTFERDRLGRVYGEWGTKLEYPQDIVLTISNSIQYRVEKALARGAIRVNAKSGRAIVLNPKTGEVLAMANYPAFDPNKFRELKSGEWRNRSIQDMYAPGSVFKLVTYGAALEANLIDPEEQIDCGNGQITIGNHTFSDSHGVGKVSYTKAFAQSSNVGAIKTGMRVGKDRFYDYARRFGFGTKTGIDLPAEAKGLLRSPTSWNGDSLASMSIGYEVGVTAMQSAVAFATIANNGIRVKPFIIKEIRNADGTVATKNDSEEVRVVSTETAARLRKMLQQVVLNGTAKRAQLRGYSSAGKTGTAWKYDKKINAVNRNKYVSSFIGFAPAKDPEVVIAVVMDEPRGALRYGGQVAAPVFKEIAEMILPEFGIAPDSTTQKMVADETLEEVKPEADDVKDNSKKTVVQNVKAPDKNTGKIRQAEGKVAIENKKGKDKRDISRERKVVKPNRNTDKKTKKEAPSAPIKTESVTSTENTRNRKLTRNTKGNT